MTMIPAIAPVEICPFSGPELGVALLVPVERDPPALRVLDPPVPWGAVGTPPAFAIPSSGEAEGSFAPLPNLSKAESTVTPPPSDMDPTVGEVTVVAPDGIGPLSVVV